jgi:hypothetical protein
LGDNEGADEEDMPLTDPEGWELYVKATEKPYEYMLDFATSVAAANPENSQIQAKCLLYFIKADKADIAMKAAVKLIFFGPVHPKTARVLDIFKEYCKTAKFENPEDLSDF